MAVRRDAPVTGGEAAALELPHLHGAVAAAGRTRRPSRATFRRRRTAFSMVLVGLVAAVWLGVRPATSPGGDGQEPLSRAGTPQAMVVARGDTLWDIAHRYASAGVPWQTYARRLVDLNGLDGVLQAGQRVRLPR